MVCLRTILQKGLTIHNYLNYQILNGLWEVSCLQRHSLTTYITIFIHDTTVDGSQALHASHV